MSPRPIGTTTIAVLLAVAEGVEYGFDIIDRTGLASGTVYPALASLERRGLVESRWEAEETARRDGRPRRRYYDITPDGRATLAAAMDRLDHMGLAGTERPRPADG